VGACHGRAYAPRQTQACDALAIVREHLPAFVQRVEQAGGSLPSFVTSEWIGEKRMAWGG